MTDEEAIVFDQTIALIDSFDVDEQYVYFNLIRSNGTDLKTICEIASYDSM